MIHHRTFLLFILLIEGIPLSQPADDKKTPVDSLEKTQAQLIIETNAIQSKLDSLNSIVRKEYIKEGLSDTITAVIEKDGIVYEKPDILSKKVFKVKKKEIIILIGFSGEWFKIIHKTGIGFVLEESVQHDDTIYNYKKLHLNKKDNEE